MGNGACSNLEQYLKGLKAALALGEAVPHKRSRALAGAGTTTVQAQVHTKTHPSLSCSNTVPLWGAGRQESTHLGGKNQLNSNLRASAPPAWDSLPPLIGWCWPLSRREASSHTWLWLETLHL